MAEDDVALFHHLTDTTKVQRCITVDRPMAKGSVKLALKALRYFGGLANWGEVALAALRGEDVLRLQLRNGLVLHGVPQTGLLGKYKDIWYHDVYGLRSHRPRPGGTVIDVGANVGVFSLYAVVLGKAARVLCYEPFGENVALLRRNMQENQIPGLQVFQMGVAGRQGMRTLHVSAGHGHNSLFAIPSEVATVDVPCVSLADAFEANGVDRCDFLKLDCEGAEYEILLEAPRWVLSRVDRVALEYHNDLSGHSDDELQRMFGDAGFKVRRRGRAQSGILFASRMP